MSEETLEPEAPAKAEVTYTIQVERKVGLPRAPDVDAFDWLLAWVDVATISVAPRTHRKRLIAKALTDAGIKPEPGQPSPRVRVLDEESAFVHEPAPHQPEPEWRV